MSYYNITGFTYEFFLMDGIAMNNNKNMVAFRISRKGYDKQDVNEYIEDMSFRFTSSEAQLKARIKELEAKLELVEEDEVSKIKAEASRLETENAMLKEEIKKLSDSIAEKENQEAEDNTASEQLEYNDISEKLGNIILKANLDAQRIVSEAELEASKQLSEAEKSANDIRLDATVSARIMAARIKEKLELLTEEYLSGLKSASEGSVREYQKLYEELKIKFDEIGKFQNELR